MVGRRTYSGQSSHLPLKINTSGVIPPIFASSILLFPSTVTGFIDHPLARWVQDHLAPGSWLYMLVYVGLIVFFCYFYTAVTFNPADVADNMKKFGGYIPGIRPGQRTAEYIDRILTRITLPGALSVAAVCVLPTILISRYNVPLYFVVTALLLVVGVALEALRGRPGLPLGAVRLMALHREDALQRLAGWRVCAEDGAMIHSSVEPPAQPDRCHRGGGSLVQRARHREETVRHRTDVCA